MFIRSASHRSVYKEADVQDEILVPKFPLRVAYPVVSLTVSDSCFFIQIYHIRLNSKGCTHVVSLFSFSVCFWFIYGLFEVFTSIY